MEEEPLEDDDTVEPEPMVLKRPAARMRKPPIEEMSVPSAAEQELLAPPSKIHKFEEPDLPVRRLRRMPTSQIPDDSQVSHGFLEMALGLSFFDVYLDTYK